MKWRHHHSFHLVWTRLDHQLLSCLVVSILNLLPQVFYLSLHRVEREAVRMLKEDERNLLEFEAASWSPLPAALERQFLAHS